MTYQTHKEDHIRITLKKNFFDSSNKTPQTIYLCRATFFGVASAFVFCFFFLLVCNLSNDYISKYFTRELASFFAHTKSMDCISNTSWYIYIYIYAYATSRMYDDIDLDTHWIVFFLKCFYIFLKLFINKTWTLTWSLWWFLPYLPCWLKIETWMLVFNQMKWKEGEKSISCRENWFSNCTKASICLQNFSTLAVFSLLSLFVCMFHRLVLAICALWKDMIEMESFSFSSFL